MDNLGSLDYRTPESLRAKGIFPTLADIRQRLTGLDGKVHYLPNECICSACGKLVLNQEWFDFAELMPPDVTNQVNLSVVLCQCKPESEKFQQRTLRRLHEANLPFGDYPRTLLNFDLRHGTETAFSVTKDYVDLGYERRPFLVLCGGVGVGKTHLLEAIGRYLIEHHESVRYEMVPDLLGVLRKAVVEGRAEEKLDGYKHYSVVLLDDLGVERVTDFALEQLMLILDHRYRQMQPTVIATNLVEQEIAEKLGARIASRLFDRRVSQVVVMTATDYRRQG